MATASREAPADQGVTFVELFFDLVFVFAVTEVTGLLHHDLTAGGVARFVLVFWLVYLWVSIGHAQRRRAVVGFAAFSSVALVTAVAGGIAAPPLRTWLWGLTAGVDVLAAWRGARAGGWDIRPAHFAERHALFVIMALGESLIAAGGPAASAPRTSASRSSCWACPSPSGGPATRGAGNACRCCSSLRSSSQRWPPTRPGRSPASTPSSASVGPRP